MAYIGLARPTIAKRTGKGAYENPFKCGKAIETDIDPQIATGELYGDNTAAETDSTVTHANVRLKTTNLPVEAADSMFGHTVNKSPASSAGEGAVNEIICKSNDQPNYVGYGFVKQKKVDGKLSYEATWLPKVQFNEPKSAMKTKGKTIEYQVPEINGMALPEDDGEWQRTVEFDTDEHAQAWVDKMAGGSPAAASVQSGKK